jgi:hypothetical protein
MTNSRSDTLQQETSLKTFIVFVMVISAAALCGCADMREAGSQEIQLAVSPMTAACDALQHDAIVGRSNPGQQSITVPKSPGATDVVCYAPGYKDKRITVVPDSPGVLGAVLTDLGPVQMAAYPGRLQIVMEPADRPGQPR